MIGIVLVFLLVLILLGGIGGPYVGAPWTYGYGYGHAPIGIFGILLLVMLIFLLMGRVG